MIDMREWAVATAVAAWVICGTWALMLVGLRLTGVA